MFFRAGFVPALFMVLAVSFVDNRRKGQLLLNCEERLPEAVSLPFTSFEVIAVVVRKS